MRQARMSNPSKRHGSLMRKQNNVASAFYHYQTRDKAPGVGRQTFRTMHRVVSDRKKSEMEDDIKDHLIDSGLKGVSVVVANISFD